MPSLALVIKKNRDMIKNSGIPELKYTQTIMEMLLSFIGMVGSRRGFIVPKSVDYFEGGSCWIPALILR